MTTLLGIAAVLAVGAVLTLIGAPLIERAHRPRGRFIEIDGFPQHLVELNPDAARSATPVVLLHGAGANLEDMNLALGERLAASRRVILIDRPGLGFSARKAGEGNSPAFQAVVLRDVLDRLGIRRAILVGHSWGGTLALTFALDFPERAAGLVLASPPTHPSLYGLSKLNAVLASPLGWLFARTLALPFGVALIRPGSRAAFRPQPIPRRYVKRTAAMLVLRPPTLLANWADVGGLEPFLARQVRRYGALSTPTIVFAGDRDLLAPPAKHAAKLAAAAPKVRLAVLGGFGHMLHHGAADRIVSAVEEMESAPAHSVDSASKL